MKKALWASGALAQVRGGRKKNVLSYRKAAAARAQMMRVLHWKLGAGKENGSAADLIGKMSSAPTSTNAVHDLQNLIVLS